MNAFARFASFAFRAVPLWFVAFACLHARAWADEQNRVEPKDAQAVAVDLYGDPLPSGAIARLGTTRYRCGGWASRLTFLPGGRLLVDHQYTGGTPVILDVETGKRLHVFDLQPRDGFVSADGSRLAFLICEGLRDKGRYECALNVLDGESFKSIYKREWHTTLEAPPEHVAISPDGWTVAVSDRNGQLKLWSLAGDNPEIAKKIAAGQTNDLAFSPDGRRLILAAEGDVFLWDWAAGGEAEKLPRGASRHQFARYSPDGKWLAVHGIIENYSLTRIWDAERRRPAWRFPPGALAHEPHSLAFTPDSKAVAVSMLRPEKCVQLLDVATGKLLRQFDSDAVGPIAISPDGQYLAVIDDGHIFAWRMKTGEALHEKYVGNRDGIRAAVFSPDGTAVFSGDMSGEVRAWDAATGRQVREVDHGTFPGSSIMRASPNGECLVSVNPWGDIRVWNAESGDELFRFAGHNGEAGLINEVLGFKPDGERLFSFGSDLYLREWDLRHGRAVAEHAIRPSGLRIEEDEMGNLISPDDRNAFDSKSDTIRFVSLAPQGERLLMRVKDAIHVFDTATGQELHRFEAGKEVDAMVVTPDGQFAATMEQRVVKPAVPPPPGTAPTREAFVRLREVDTWKVVDEFALPGSWQPKLFLSADGKLLAAEVRLSSTVSSSRSLVVIWDLAARRELLRFDPSGPVWTLAFSSDGSRLATAHGDSLLVWDMNALSKLAATEE